MLDKKISAIKTRVSIDGIEHYRLPAAWRAADNFRHFAMMKRVFMDSTRTYEGIRAI